MKKMMLCIAAVFTLVSGSVFAQTVSARGATLDEAEAKIAAKAQAQGAGYRIIGADTNNYVYMIGELIHENTTDEES